VNQSRALEINEMNLFLRVLTVGVVSSASHSYKYGFAAMMKDANAPGAILNSSLNHVATSPVSEAYARFASDHNVDVFIAEQQEESLRRELDFQLLEGWQ
jgi:hypothetical protein